MIQFYEHYFSHGLLNNQLEKDCFDLNSSHTSDFRCGPKKGNLLHFTFEWFSLAILKVLWKVWKAQPFFSKGCSFFFDFEDHKLDPAHFGWSPWTEPGTIPYLSESILLSYLKLCNLQSIKMTWYNDIESEDFPKQKTKFSMFSTKYDDKKLFKVQSWWCFGCFFLLRCFFSEKWRIYDEFFFHIFLVLKKLSNFENCTVTPQNLPDSVEDMKDPNRFQLRLGWERACFFGWTLVGGTGHLCTSARCFGAAPGYHLGSVILSAFLKTLFRGRVFWVSGCLLSFVAGQGHKRRVANLGS